MEDWMTEDFRIMMRSFQRYAMIIPEKKVEYMEHHIGEEFEGIISGVINRGIFVELPNTIEGFVDVSTLYDDFYVYSQDEYAMIGESTGKKYSIGDTVKVKVGRQTEQTDRIRDPVRCQRRR